ncbi:MAG: hypothetical protein M3Z04_23400 [Chloroflexota bacterium]|nr:hypothetical protein [Chloroflexota bacterium]
MSLLNDVSSFCPVCGQEYNSTGQYPLNCQEEGWVAEAREGWAAEALAWAKQFLPEGWYRQHWQIVREQAGVMMNGEHITGQYNLAAVVDFPDGWYAVVMCEPFDGSGHFYFSPKDEQSPAGPFPTEATATATILQWFTFLEEVLLPLPASVP